MRILAACLVHMLLALVRPDTLHAQPSQSPQGATLGVTLCRDGPPTAAAEAAVRAGIIRAVAPATKDQTIAIRTLPCGELMPDASCFAQERGLSCRISSLLRIFKAAAWLTMAYTRAGALEYEEFRLRNDRPIASAFRYADGVLAAPEVDPFTERLQRAYVQSTEYGRVAKDDGISVAQDAIFRTLVNASLAILIGHEITHAMGEKCPLTEPARVEQSGLLKRLIAMQSSNELFCPRVPALEEVRADSCGVRHLARLKVRVTRETGDVPALAVAWRLSADVLAFQSVFGWLQRAGFPAGSYNALPLNSYLYESSRLLLFSVEAHGADARPAVCGEAASLFTHVVQETFKRCTSGKGQVADDILAYFPPQLEKSWNGAPWTAESFACKL